VGTAVLGSVLNARLARELGSIGSDPFVQIAARAHPGMHLDRVDANSLQAILTQPLRGLLEKQLASLPGTEGPRAHQALLTFVARSRQAFAVSITETFLIAAVLMGLAWVVSLFLREIPLRRSHGERPGEAAAELAMERSVLPAEDEPDLD
jgi:hypothetical protein